MTTMIYQDLKTGQFTGEIHEYDDKVEDWTSELIAEAEAARLAVLHDLRTMA